MIDKTVTTQTKKEILALADEMAACTSSLNAQTYDHFISSREKLEEILNITEKNKMSL
jgi:hypothetical protein